MRLYACLPYISDLGICALGQTEAYDAGNRSSGEADSVGGKASPVNEEEEKLETCIIFSPYKLGITPASRVGVRDCLSVVNSGCRGPCIAHKVQYKVSS